MEPVTAEFACMTVGEIKERFGYMTQRDRPVCRTCAHAAMVRIASGRDAIDCTLGGFRTKPESVCDRYMREG